MSIKSEHVNSVKNIKMSTQINRTQYNLNLNPVRMYYPSDQSKGSFNLYNQPWFKKQKKVKSKKNQKITKKINKNYKKKKKKKKNIKNPKNTKKILKTTKYKKIKKD